MREESFQILWYNYEKGAGLTDEGEIVCLELSLLLLFLTIFSLLLIIFVWILGTKIVLNMP